ncbi:hypothetical protein ACLOJK_040656 [Asimina triloba]
MNRVTDTSQRGRRPDGWADAYSIVGRQQEGTMLTATEATGRRKDRESQRETGARRDEREGDGDGRDESWTRGRRWARERSGKMGNGGRKSESSDASGLKESIAFCSG